MTATPLPRKPTGKLAFAYQTIAALEQVRADLEAELSAHKAARIAYASEFLLDSEGEPDVGSIHQNIRALKAENQRLREALAGLIGCIDHGSENPTAKLDAASTALKEQP